MNIDVSALPEGGASSFHSEKSRITRAGGTSVDSNVTTDALGSCVLRLKHKHATRGLGPGACHERDAATRTVCQLASKPLHSSAMVVGPFTTGFSAGNDNFSTIPAVSVVRIGAHTTSDGHSPT